jgi:hypothetical protein
VKPFERQGTLFARVLEVTSIGVLSARSSPLEKILNDFINTPQKGKV